MHGNRATTTVHIVQDILERRDVIIGFNAVKAVVDCDVTNAFFTKENFAVIARLDVVSSKPRQILCDYEIDFSGVDVGNHALKIRPVKIHPCIAIVYIRVKNTIAVVLAKFFYRLF